MKVTELLIRAGACSDRGRLLRAVAYIQEQWPKVHNFDDNHVDALKEATNVQPSDPLHDFPTYVLNRLDSIGREMLACAVTRVFTDGQVAAIREERLALQRNITAEMDLESPAPYQGR